MVPTISQGTVIPMEIELDPNITTTYAPPTLSTNTNKVRHGTTLDVVCVDQYEFPVSTLAAPTCNNGTWSVIPRCIPARCKGLPRPPKFGMVLAPKTEHGMKARFKCKDGFNLTGPGGKEITDMNDFVLTCSFGNWTGDSPQCSEVYCSFPGYITHGKILLVGNMGLYDYRPYVKKIINNKQIMYDCDKGYVLGEGPPGATCVGGLWRPTDMPKCLLGQHPRLRWTRRRRSVEMRFARSRYLLSNYRHLQRYVDELLDGGQQLPERSGNRTKRSFQWTVTNAEADRPADSLVGYSQSAMAHMFNVASPVQKRQRFFDGSANHRRVSRTLSTGTEVYRKQRRPFQGEVAYAQYMQKIRQRYKQYVKNLLGYVTTTARPAMEQQFEIDLFKDQKRDRSDDVYYSANQYHTLTGKQWQSTQSPDYKVALHNQLMRRHKRDTSDVVAVETDGPSRLARKNARRNLNATAAVVPPAVIDAEADNGDGNARGKPKSPCQVNTFSKHQI